MAEQVEIQGSGSPRPLSSLGLCMWPAEQSPARPLAPRLPALATSMSMSNCLCPACGPATLPAHACVCGQRRRGIRE